MKRVLAFVCVGGAGFVADAGILTGLLAFSPLDAFTARLVSVACALCLTWFLNRQITFGASSRPIAAEGALYGGVGVSTSIVNYAIYSAILLVFPATLPLAALVIASVGAMVFSYLGYSRLVFNG